ncbi:thymidine phosphorylase [Pseudodesulfovibrio tunisiensis]|uniref:thymidine phosphorylase n=1 Tax=Pseudodesulfovibrio tunisiensis TaxID=463192 RepID=UPI001FB32BC1|nr:thymidine phosphorylase [Pseudodesulfovibrio tunisiensis]
MKLLPQEVIRTKRDGGQVAGHDLEMFVQGMMDRSVTEAQVAAFGMAVFFQGMTMEETVALTGAMTRSGTVLDWDEQDLTGPVLDKHSTGGVGDVVSLMLAPLIAACGGFVPMISGRGLGHTGGTLDKLESIPGYDVAPGIPAFQGIVREAGCAIIGQTPELAPADRMFYAVRDVTATVESIPLITASILSKKLAAGLHGLVMDVKTGSGAFMSRAEDAGKLARTIVDVARGAGLPAVALVTDMDQPLAPCAGNALEVMETVRYLTGESRDARLHEAVMALGTEMLMLGGLAPDADHARSLLGHALDSGAAADRFARMVALSGGPADFVERYASSLAEAGTVIPVKATMHGFVRRMDARQLGMAVVRLGGGRTRPQDDVDHAVGLSSVVRVGTRVEPGDPLALVHARNREQGQAVADMVSRAVTIGPEPCEAESLILRRVG